MTNLQDIKLSDTPIDDSRIFAVKNMFRRNGVIMGDVEPTIQQLSLLLKAYHQKITTFQQDMAALTPHDPNIPNITILPKTWDDMVENNGDIIQSFGTKGILELATALDKMGIDKDAFIQGEVKSIGQHTAQNTWANRIEDGDLSPNQDELTPN